MIARRVLAAASIALALSTPAPANIIDGSDGRGPIMTLGPQLGLSAAEIDRIRATTGFVACFLPSPAQGTATLFLSNDQIVTAAHLLYDRKAAQPRSNCFFRAQTGPDSPRIDLDVATARYGAVPPKAGSNSDFVVVRLIAPIPGVAPLPVAPGEPLRLDEALLEVSAHPAGLPGDFDKNAPVIQSCRVRRVPKSTAATNFVRTDCDATGSSSGGIHIARIAGEVTLRGFTITTGPWRDPKLAGAPYDERHGSQTTALGVDAAVLAAGEALRDRR